MVKDMFIKENIMLALAGLKSNKMRALLTMLGIIIGIASVIGVVSVGSAMTASVESSMSSMGATNITVNIQEKSTTSTEMLIHKIMQMEKIQQTVNKIIVKHLIMLHKMQEIKVMQVLM